MSKIFNSTLLIGFGLVFAFSFLLCLGPVLNMVKISKIYLSSEILRKNIVIGVDDVQANRSQGVEISFEPALELSLTQLNATNLRIQDILDIYTINFDFPIEILKNTSISPSKILISDRSPVIIQWND